MSSLRAEAPRVAQRFRIVRPLGVGGTAVVYEACDERTGERVALKAIPVTNAESLLKIRRELEALKGLSHPNLLRLGELFVDAGAAFLSMELVSGPNFLDYVRSPERAPGRLPFDEGRLRQALAQLAAGLLALHATGRVHRDVKPENVLVTQDGRVVLVDFGLVSDVDKSSDHDSSDAAGTALYMAPEQAAGKPVGPEADWYGMGVMLYEALTGCHPYVGSSLEVLIEKQRSDPAPVREREPRAPEDLSELCAQLLRFTPHKRPSGRAVLRRLSAPAPGAELGARSSHSLLAVLRGREAEFHAFDQALAELRSGKPRVLALCGEPGSGKTRLLGALCSRALEAGASVVFGRVDAMGPYNALQAVMEPIAELLRAAPSSGLPIEHGDLLRRTFMALEDVPMLGAALKKPDPQELRANMFSAVRALFGRLASAHVLVLALDDFQEADRDSLAALNELFRAPDAPPVLFVVGMLAGRDQAPWSRLSVTQLPLARLEPYHAQALALDLTAMTGQKERAGELAARAQGSPLLLEELVRLCALAGDPEDVGSLEDACRLRAQRLPVLARRAAELLALTPSVLGLDVLAQALGVNAPEMSRLASVLVLLGFAHAANGSRGETLRLAHAAFRAPLLSATTGEELRARHLQLCRALELSSQGTAELLAHHYDAGAADKMAAGRALEAGEAAEKALAFERAASLFAAAQRQLEGRPQEARVARVRAGRALALAGQGVRSAEAYVAARPGANAAEALDLGQRAAQQLVFAGQIHQGAELLRSTLASEAITYPATPLRAFLRWLLDRARLKLRGLRFREKDSSQLPSHMFTRIDACWHASMMLAVSDTLRCNFFVLRSLLDALKAGQPYRVARALAIHAGVMSQSGVRSEPHCEGLFRTAEALLAGAGSPPHGQALVLGARGQARFLAGRFADALDLCTRTERILRNECSEVPWELNVVRVWGARSLQYMGNHRELARRMPGLLEECRQRGNLYGEVSLLLSVQPHVLVAQGDPHGALQAVLEGQRRWPADGFHVQHYHGLISRVTIALYDEHPREAYERASEALAGVHSSLLQRIQFVRVVTHAACGLAAITLARSSADQALLRKRARAHARRLLSEGAAWSVPQGEVLLAGLAHAESKREPAIVLLRKAAAGFAATKMALHAASTRLYLGQLLGGSEGEALLREADALMRDRGVERPFTFAATLVPLLPGKRADDESTRIRRRTR
jgi:hypothetical protein